MTSDRRSKVWAVVAGATGALGAPIVEALALRGMRVLAVARQAGELSRAVARLPEVVPLSADLADDRAESTIADQLDATVKAVVHVAGAPLGGSVHHVRTAAMTASFEVKVNGLLRLVRAAEPYLAEGSRIVAVTGSLGYDPLPGSATAGVSNAAMANLVRQLNRALGPRGVTCHAIAPGPVESPRLDALVDDLAAAEGLSPDTVRSKLLEAASVSRFTSPEDVAWAVTMMLDESATALAGSTLFLDAGRRTAIP